LIFTPCAPAESEVKNVSAALLNFKRCPVRIVVSEFNAVEPELTFKAASGESVMLLVLAIVVPEIVKLPTASDVKPLTVGLRPIVPVVVITPPVILEPAVMEDTVPPPEVTQLIIPAVVDDNI